MNECPQCEYHKNRAARWRAEAYKQAGHDVIERPWVGLTDEDVMEITGVTSTDSDWNVVIVNKWIRAIEAKLKEKNG